MKPAEIMEIKVMRYLSLLLGLKTTYLFVYQSGTIIGNQIFILTPWLTEENYIKVRDKLLAEYKSGVVILNIIKLN